ncbi:MAG: PD40 domain-containing protein [Acidobacteria bacterium]|nr:PD40 domain-containing protein [Acidobacteriota bacterium]
MKRGTGLTDHIALRPAGRYQIGDYCVDFDRRSIAHGTLEERLPVRPMALLFILVQEAGNPVDRSTLIDRVWEGNIYTGPKAVTDAVWRLRKAFRDTSDLPTYIETIAKKGYRLLPDVTQLDVGEAPQNGKKAWWFAWMTGAALLLWLMLRPSPDAPVPLASLHPVTYENGVEHDASISGDGRMLAYAQLAPGGRSRIAIMPLGQPDVGPSFVDPEGSGQRFPSWSPDGNQLAWMHLQGDQPPELVVWDRVAGVQTRFSSVGALPLRLEWHPSGGRIAFSRYDAHEDRCGIAVLDLSSRSHPFLVSRSVSPHFCDMDPHWSPDGSQLLFIRRDQASSDLFVTDMSGNARQLTSDHVPILGADWEPNGSILFASSRSRLANQAPALWRIDEGLEPQLFAASSTGLMFPECNPATGDVLVYNARPAQQLVGIQLDGSNVMRTWITSSHDDTDPHYSAELDRLVFASTRTGHQEIWTSQLDGSDLQRMTDLQSGAAFPRWSPDGQSIVFVAQNPQQKQRTLFLLDVAQRQIRQLGEPTAFLVCPSWALDGRSIYCVRNQGTQLNLWNIPLDGGGGSAVTEDDGFFGQESLDRKWIYFTRDKTPGLWRRSLRGAEMEKLIDWGGVDGLTWVPTADGILFTTASPAGTEVVKWVDGETKVLATLPQAALGARPICYIASKNLLLATQVIEAQGDLNWVRFDRSSNSDR